MYRVGDLVTIRSNKVYNKEESKYQGKVGMVCGIWDDAVFISGFTDPSTEYLIKWDVSDIEPVRDVNSSYLPEKVGHFILFGECVEKDKKYPLKGTVCFRLYFNEVNLQIEICALVWCYSEWQKREWDERRIFLNLDGASAFADKLNNRMSELEE